MGTLAITAILYAVTLLIAAICLWQYAQGEKKLTLKYLIYALIAWTFWPLGLIVGVGCLILLFCLLLITLLDTTHQSMKEVVLWKSSEQT